MSVLPDCSICGGPVVLEPEGDRGPVEACQGECGNAQRMPTPRINRAEIRAQARQVVQQARRKGLPIMRCPSCKQDRCHDCHASGCECPGNHPRRTRVAP